MLRSYTSGPHSGPYPKENESGNDYFSDMDRLFKTGKHVSHHWSISWSDLMMTMFILFLVLYVYHKANKNFSLGDKTDQLNENTAGIAGNVFTDSNPDRYRLDTLKLEYSADISSVDLARDKTVRIVLPGDLLFDPGETRLKPKAMESLVDLAKIINRTSYMVNVVGHTDNLPVKNQPYGTNWELSTMRACTVARYLIDEMKIEPKRFFVTGHGEHFPIRPNNSSKNRAANRRVEIILTKEKPHAPKDILYGIL